MKVLSTLLVCATTATLAGCGGSPAAEKNAPRPGVGSIHAVVQTASGATRSLSVEYAAAGLSSSQGEDGALVIVGVFRDGRVDESLDLETLSINVPLSALPGASGTLDTIVRGSDLTVLLEGSADSETRVLAPDAVRGTLHLRYDAPPRPGITLRGDFSLELDTIGNAGHSLKLEGELDVPVLGR